MFSIIQKLLKRARLFDALYDRIEKIEAKLERFEKLADENESLWQYLDDQKEMDNLFVGSAEEFEEEFTDIMLRNMKPHGDA
jgi:predicted DNA binding CopG/RHH family protein